MELKIMEEGYDRYEANYVEISRVTENKYVLIESNEIRGVRVTIFNDKGEILKDFN